MQILLAFIVGAAIGAAAHATMPHRGTRGMLIAPFLGAIVGGVVWLVLTWAGVGTDSPWLWLVLTWAGVGTDSPWLWLGSFLAPAIVTVPVVALLSRARLNADRRERARLKIA